jgi:hydroxypyruvate isomerase
MPPRLGLSGCELFEESRQQLVFTQLNLEAEARGSGVKMYSLSVCADTILLQRSFLERVREISRAGFLVEFWSWSGRDLDAIATDPGIQICAFTGYLKGCMVHPEGIEEFLRGIQTSLDAAARLRCKALFLSSGQLDERGQVAHNIAAHPATRWISAYKTLCRVAEIAEKHDLVFNVEHLNTKVDHPGFPFARVEDVVSVLREVGSTRIKLLFDIYHAQVEEGSLIDTIRECHSFIGHIHVADVPGRHEPGTGEIRYRRVAEALREVGYNGVVGLEAYPQADDFEAMTRFREVFS